MLRALITRTTAAEMAPALDSMNLQVRWRRKPRWLGTAKTKLFRVPERPIQDREERDLMFRLSSHYRTQMKAINYFLHQEFKKKESEVSVLHKSPEQIQAEWEECSALNNAWNAEVAKVREARLEREAKVQERVVLQKLAAKERREEKASERIKKVVVEQKQQQHTFITEENIDQAIEHALANPTDYNYAIDLNGNMYRGRDGDTPEPVFQAKVSAPQQ